MLNQITSYLNQEKSAKPLAVFRIGFGLMMAISLIRFWAKGWIESLYLLPKHHFPFFGWDWVSVLQGNGMYYLFSLLILASLLIATGKYYLPAIITFFLGFTYIELIDKTYYLNHYYFVSLVSFLLIFLPADKEYHLNRNWKFSVTHHSIKQWEVGSIRLMLGMVYCFAGIAKINPDWVFNAMPLSIWLRGQTHLPIIGQYLDQEWVAYAFSYFGLIYDCTIAFFLINKTTRPYAYIAVLGFHLACIPLFQIGMFPWIMIVSTLVFFPFEQQKLQSSYNAHPNQKKLNWKMLLFGVFFLIQCLLPFRYLIYEGPLFWTEQGYRFSWRVMLMEKAGTMFYTVKGKQNGTIIGEEVDHSKYITPNQEKMISTQPDMIIEYAQILEEEYSKKGWTNIKVYAEIYVTVNGRRSTLFTQTDVDLTQVKPSEIKSFIQPSTF